MQQPNMNSTQPGCIRDHFFATVFPSGVTIGGSPFHATWTTAAAVEAFLPATTTPGVLTANLTNPTSTPAGVFAGQLLALKLNVGFSCAGIFYQLGMQPAIICVGDLTLPDTCAGKFGDMTVDELIALADEVIAGNVSALTPFGASVSELSGAVGCINELFDECGSESSMLSSSGLVSDLSPNMDALEASILLPTEFVVTGVQPNPLLETVAISYGLPRDGAVNIDIYNIQGQRVVTLVSDMQSAGYRSTTWDGKDTKGASTAPGVYFLRAQFEDRPEIMVKMVKLH
jgi:hypothetical protein